MQVDPQLDSRRAPAFLPSVTDPSQSVGTGPASQNTIHSFETKAPISSDSRERALPATQPKTDTGPVVETGLNNRPDEREAEDSRNRRAKADWSENELIAELPQDNSTHAHAAEDDDDFDTIKAKTMFKMVEELPGTSIDQTRKLLLLSAKQADLISGSSESIEKMLTIGFEVPTPKLVINLAPSLFLTAAGERQVASRHFPKLDFRGAIEALDRFMLETLIPLAAQTHAVILCSATNCGLAASLTRALSLMRSRWGQKPPFTIISCCADAGSLYFNTNPHAAWREIRTASKIWKQREPHLLQVLRKHVRTKCVKDPNWVPDYATAHHDLDRNAVNFLVADVSTDKELYGPNHKRHYNQLVTAIFRHLSSKIPSIVLKTGRISHPTLDVSSLFGLDRALDAVNTESPVLLLDCLNRPLPHQTEEERKNDGSLSVSASGEKKREELIEWATKHEQQQIDEQGAVAACLNGCMEVAWWHSILCKDGDPRTVKAVQRRQRNSETLYEAILLKRGGSEGQDDYSLGMPPATEQQRLAAMSWLLPFSMQAEHEFNEQLLKSLRETPRKSWEEEQEEKKGLHEQAGVAWCLQTSALFNSKFLHTVNLRHTKSDDVKKMVSALVRLDRLPPENSLEGLNLLKRAWDEHDIAQHLAGRYKVMTKLLFFLHLLLAFSIVCISSLSYDGELELPRDALRDVVFYLTVGATFLISFEAFLNAKAKWRQLRSFAGSLESITWQYRCRVDPFDSDRSNPDLDRAEQMLGDALVAWRRGMSSGAELLLSALHKKYPDSVFRHGQRAAGKVDAGAEGNDHFSPVQADEYVAMRLLPMIEWYESRIPWRHRLRLLLRVAMLVVTAACSVLARHALGPGVAILTAFTSVITSWSEFSDSSRKIERYNSVIESVSNLLTWWERIWPLERASTANIAKLVKTGEAVVSQELLAWQSTAGRHGAVAKEAGEEERAADAGAPPAQQQQGVGAALRSSTRIHPQAVDGQAQP